MVLPVLVSYDTGSQKPFYGFLIFVGILILRLCFEASIWSNSYAVNGAYSDHHPAAIIFFLQFVGDHIQSDTQ